MYLQWFLAFEMITSTNGITKMITPDFKAFNFAKETRGRSVIREMEVEVDSEGS